MFVVWPTPQAEEAGVFAAFFLGLSEAACAGGVKLLRRVIPREAMMAALGGVSITFISMPFIFQIFETPAVALLPFGVVLLSWGSRVRLPLRIPGAAAALMLGAGIGWSLHLLGSNTDKFFGGGGGGSDQVVRVDNLPWPCFGLFRRAMRFDLYVHHLPNVLPLMLVNLISNLACVESAAQVGDDCYDATTARQICAFI